VQNDVKLLPKMNDVRDLISITDIGILSSRYSEYICRIALEFMAFSKPVVAPDLNAIPDVVKNKVTGFIYDMEDSQMAADFIVKLANDTKLTNKLGENGFKRINEYYSMKVFSGEVEKILVDIK